MAPVALQLFTEPHRWIHRRVERINFLDRETIHRQVSVDFTLPAGVTPVGRFENRDMYIAPLFLLGKDHPQPLRLGKQRHWWAWWRAKYRERLPMALYSDVDFADATGKRLPLITRAQSNELANAMLQLAATKVLSRPISKSIRQKISEVVLTDRRHRHDALLSLLLQEPEKGLASPRTDLGNSDFAELACLMATHCPIACLFTDGPPGRTVVKISFDEPMDDERTSSKGRMWRSIGWKSEYLSVRVNEVGAAASHHIEVDIPGELQINSLGLTGKSYIVANHRWKDLASNERDYVVRQVAPATKGNLYMSGLPYPRRMGRVMVKMRARRSGFLLGALVISATMTVVLAVLLRLVSDDLLSRSDGSVAALLLLPSVVAAYIARPMEHVITARMLFWARLVLVGNAALPFLAVIFLLTTPNASSSAGSGIVGALREVLGLVHSHDSSVHNLKVRWVVLAGLSALCTCLFVISNIWPRSHGVSKYVPMPNDTDEMSSEEALQ
jgi:hypothetical protein